ncbi:hypothetical protein WKI68_20985 [Streptomyces sp. MS1.HAVA.3]|uniref:Serine/threonine protein kinase n=1 Tax=Streptomyces caledonius TaxID=3134107 RepID=A0ABU8U5N7_9ACTN
MERLRHDDPPHIGPHIALARLDAESEQAVPARRFIARSADGDRTFLAFLPRIDVDPTRWAIEAEGARRLSIPGFLPVGEVGGTAGLPWYTAPYVPALPLPAALRAHGGPLPEPVVRALGATLARTLSTAHARGVTHAGLSPAAVLLTTEGSRLSCFGRYGPQPRTASSAAACPALTPAVSPRNKRPVDGRARWATCTPWGRCSPTREPATPSPNATNFPLPPRTDLGLPLPRPREASAGAPGPHPPGVTPGVTPGVGRTYDGTSGHRPGRGRPDPPAGTRGRRARTPVGAGPRG